MSRVILTCHPADEKGDEVAHLVVGWDKPLATYYWQIMGAGDDEGIATAYCGYKPNELPTWNDFMQSLPAEFEDKFSEKLLRDLLESHQGPGKDDGNVVVDWSNPPGWVVEVIADNSGVYVSNAVVIADREQALAYADRLSRSWALVEKWRVVPTNEPPTYEFVNGTLHRKVGV